MFAIAVSCRRSTPVTALCILSLLAGCGRSAVPPVRAPWAEQFAAAERATKELGSDFVIVSVEALPVRGKQGAPDEPIELNVALLFVRRASSQVNARGVPLHAARIVHFNDHRLATTLRVDNEFLTEHSPDPTSLERAGLIRLSPQDVLQLTLTEGQAYMGKPVDAGNIEITLSRVSEKPPEVNALAVWNIIFHREKAHLSILVDAQTGAILMRSTKDT